MIADDLRRDDLSGSPERGSARPSGRVLTARRRLPSGRAVVGGLLVAIAALGAIVVSTSSSGPTEVRVVVADAAITPGILLGPDVLRVESMALPDALLDGTFDDTEELIGTVARSTLAPGELLQSGDVVESTAAQRSAAPAREMSLHLESTRIGGGELESGDRIDVIATYGTGDDAFTTVVLRDAPVVVVRSTDDAIGAARGVTLTLGLESRRDTVALAHAIDVAQISVVRTTTAQPDDEGVEPFRADPTTSDSDGDTGSDSPTEPDSTSADEDEGR
jgi:Flp pilus assembly protein CpaB